MNGLFRLALVLAGLLLLPGCQNPSEELPALLPTDGPVERLYITHFRSGGSHSWVLEGDACQEFTAWIAQLEFQPVAFEEGASPGDSEGGEVYDIALEQGGASCFSYVIAGDAVYLLVDGDWYAVQNPSPPPAGDAPAE